MTDIPSKQIYHISGIFWAENPMGGWGSISLFGSWGNSKEGKEFF